MSQTPKANQITKPTTPYYYMCVVGGLTIFFKAFSKKQITERTSNVLQHLFEGIRIFDPYATPDDVVNHIDLTCEVTEEMNAIESLSVKVKMSFLLADAYKRFYDCILSDGKVGNSILLQIEIESLKTAKL